ncbi:MAG: hypothetical protein AB8B80_11900, partial [Marinicellaceae bacterium]
MSLDELQWSKNIWPKDSKKPKPNYTEIKNIEKIRQSVHKSLKMQQLLLDEFNFEISADMLQSDMNRMASNSKDTNHLRQMFAVLDNHPNTIAQCISRPYLVEKNFTKYYNSNKNIHAHTKSNAQLELDRYKHTQNRDEIDADVFVVSYQLKLDDEKKSTQSPTDKIIVELGIKEFNHKLKLLNNTQLQEQESAFIHTEIITQTKDSLTVRIFKWAKTKQHTWLQSKPNTKYKLKDNNNVSHPYILPKITGSNNQFNHNATTADTWYNAIDPRQSHTAVWTGSEMIVWGGFNESEFLNTGGRYNPSNDSWVATSIGMDVPIARVEHTAIWTGTEMIIWGGIDEINNYLGTGSRYDPVDDSWKTTSTEIDAPLGRSDHTVIWTGTEMIIWGGVLPGNILTQTGARYNPSNDSWLPTNIGANVPSQRTAHTAIWTGTEMIIWGGRDSIDTINTGGRYNPVSNTWEPTKLDSSTPQGKYSHSAVWTGTEMIIFGGFVYEFFIPAKTNTGGRYNPDDDTWINTNHQTLARADHFAFWTGIEMIVLSEPNDGGNRGSIYSPTFDSWTDITDVGLVYNYRVSSSVIFTGTDIIIWGGNIDSTSTGMTNTGNRYNLDSNTWTVTGFGINVPSFRQKHTAIWTGTEMIIWGGNDGPFFEGLLNTGSRYNPASNVWTAISDGINVPSARSLHTAIWTGAEMIVWGGIDSDSLLNSGGRYNPLSDSWLATSTGVNVPSQRAYHTTVWTGEEMIIWGGNNLNAGNINTGGRYNPSDDSWVSTSTGANVPSIRLGHTAVWTGDEMIIWGGNDGSNINVFLNTGGRYNPTSNSWLPTSLGINTPTERVGHTAVWTGTEMIIWGGGNSTGGRYNPISGNWLTTSTGTNVPSIRTTHSAIWTGEEMIIWGGDDLNTGGRYYPSDDSWLPTSVTNAPTGRSNYSVIYTGTSMIIWGGQVLQIANNTLGIYYVKSSYEISGTLSGLNGDQVILQNNGGDDLTLTTDGGFTFDTAIIEGNDYAVTVLTNPSTPNQNCTVSNGSGVDIMANVTNVQVSCVNIYNVAVTVTGLDPTNSIE